ncbi:glycosyltransferase family 2 protein [Occallatibacter riparius]|uniref:Glycosyltransferase n=1 Tax=Occallatibacter riparius TaxID=1002689 RepID=A0A9J7BY78_9BACT|nr:glycosyltransferase family 2 protein [Occallatibacter riparius]UWZ86134.1 glycosyltransferase [Occallatibacter riparius]
MPDISVCIPVYNRRDFILNAVQSALNQEVDGLEVVIVDNRSDDGTWELLQAISDPRVRVYQNETNVGMINNFTRSCNLAEGEFLLMLCSDDRLCPGFLKHGINLMRTTPSAALLSSVGRFVDPNGNCTGLNVSTIPPGLYDGISAKRAFFEFTGRYKSSIFNYPAGIMMRRSVYKKMSPFSLEVGDPTDADMWIRCLRDGDFLVTDYVGCEITRHFNQRGAESFRAGRYFEELLKMTVKHLREREDADVRKRFLHLLGGTAFPWAFNGYLKGDKSVWSRTREFGWNIPEMAIAYAERWMYRVRAKLGFVTVPGLKRIDRPSPLTGGLSHDFDGIRLGGERP